MREMQGIFTLRTVADLLTKLRHDYGRIRAASHDAYAAFDFFVTAEHIPDWMGLSRGERKALRESEALLQVVSHIASGAKHFKDLDEHHHSVTASGLRGGYFPPTYFGPSYFGGSYFGHGTLYVELDGSAVDRFGQRISAVDLADQVLTYWTEHLRPPDP
jgi:hypothetical protein